jgi:hypothetical protein
VGRSRRELADGARPRRRALSPGGISNGVRAAANVPEASVGAPKAGAHAPTNTSPSARSGNIQMDDNSYPPLPQNETAVAFNTSNEQIAVAAS